MKHLLSLAISCVLLGGCAATRRTAVADDSMGQPEVVNVGKGSYASFPPPEVFGQAKGTLNRQLYLADDVKGPIPTNKWWTNLIIDRYAGQLWAFPWMVKADAKALSLFFPVRWNDRGTDPVSDAPVEVRGDDFSPEDARAKSWSDWLVTFREAESDTKYWDVTLGRGLPYVWLECHGVAPRIKTGDENGFFDKTGAAVTLPRTGDHFGFTYAGRSYGVFAPEGTSFKQAGNSVAVGFKEGDTGYLVICPLPGKQDLAHFYQFAYAIPRDSRLDWSYDPNAAQVVTLWKLTTELLKGTEHRLIQGWLPHHYRDTTNDLKLDGLQYLTPRGTMKCAVGTDFKITYGFNGFAPFLPAPKAQGLPHDFDAGRMRDYLARYATRTDYGGDTYWGGKHLTQFGQYMAMARQMNDPHFDALRDSLRKALSDWFTYTSGEKEHFFARYPKWRALIGFNTSYGSEQFNDNHFHYGYFTSAAALLGIYDPQFLKDYGGMAKLVAKEYANWDRNDSAFPFMRTFDIWEGHSWAGGFSGGTGDNQESSSEAMQSWGGLFLLGTALGDKQMAAAGAMGYVMESHATLEYWFNIHGDNFAPNYGHPIVGMVWSGGNNYGTYFSGDPAWIYGIQWLPVSPMLSYLVSDPAFAKKNFGQMWQAYKATGKDGISSMGPALGNVILGHAAQVNPDWVAEQEDELWLNNDKVAHDNDMPGIVYYTAHANRMLGAIQWNYHLSLPVSCVYYNARTQKLTCVAYNPNAMAQVATVYKDGKPIGTLPVPGNSFLCTNEIASH